MSENIRWEIKRLLEELCLTQAEVCRRIERVYGYKVQTSGFSSAMHGLDTPKTRRMLTDALSVLTEERMRQKSLLDMAKRV